MASRAGNLTASSHDHVVKVYDDDRDLVRGITEFLSAGIRAGDLVIVVATPSHRVAFEQAAGAAAIDLVNAAANGYYLALDARETLAAFMVKGSPDPLRFDAVMGELVRTAAPRPVRIFGEMVAVLWDDGNVSGAISLESIWNDLAASYPFTLYCAYAMASFASADLTAIREVCDRHHLVVAPHSYIDEPIPIAPPDETSVTELYVPVPLAVRAVRRFVERTIRSWGEDDLLADALVIASELATNAVLHARSPFGVSLSRSEGTVRLNFTDAGDGAAAPPGATRESIGGRGLALVATLSSSWGTEPVPGGKVVWAELTSRATNAGAAVS